ncbi:unnamed protein product, partial [Polarella glacialis]
VLCATELPALCAWRLRCLLRHPVLRDVPHRRPLREERARRRAVPHDPWARAHRQGDRRGLPGDEAGGGRQRGCRLHGGFLPAVRRLQAGLRAILQRRRLDGHLWR